MKEKERDGANILTSGYEVANGFGRIGDRLHFDDGGLKSAHIHTLQAVYLMVL